MKLQSNPNFFNAPEMVTIPKSEYDLLEIKNTFLGDKKHEIQKETSSS